MVIQELYTEVKCKPVELQPVWIYLRHKLGRVKYATWDVAAKSEKKKVKSSVFQCITKLTGMSRMELHHLSELRRVEAAQRLVGGELQLVGAERRSVHQKHLAMEAREKAAREKAARENAARLLEDAKRKGEQKRRQAAAAEEAKQLARKARQEQAYLNSKGPATDLGMTGWDAKMGARMQDGLLGLTMMSRPDGVLLLLKLYRIGEQSVLVLTVGESLMGWADAAQKSAITTCMLTVDDTCDFLCDPSVDIDIGFYGDSAKYQYVGVAIMGVTSASAQIVTYDLLKTSSWILKKNGSQKHDCQSPHGRWVVSCFPRNLSDRRVRLNPNEDVPVGVHATFGAEPTSVRLGDKIVPVPRDGHRWYCGTHRGDWCAVLVKCGANDELWMLPAGSAEGHSARGSGGRWRRHRFAVPTTPKVWMKLPSVEGGQPMARDIIWVNDNVMLVKYTDWSGEAVAGDVAKTTLVVVALQPGWARRRARENTGIVSVRSFSGKVSVVSAPNGSLQDERDICQQLSSTWADDDDDDGFLGAFSIFTASRHYMEFQVLGDGVYLIDRSSTIGLCVQSSATEWMQALKQFVRDCVDWFGRACVYRRLLLSKSVSVWAMLEDRHVVGPMMVETPHGLKEDLSVNLSVFRSHLQNLAKSCPLHHACCSPEPFPSQKALFARIIRLLINLAMTFRLTSVRRDCLTILAAVKEASAGEWNHRWLLRELITPPNHANWPCYSNSFQGRAATEHFMFYMKNAVKNLDSELMSDWVNGWLAMMKILFDFDFEGAECGICFELITRFNTPTGFGPF